MKIREREAARELRRQGFSIPAIADRLNVSKGSVFSWTSGIPVPTRLTREFRRQRKDARLAVVAKEAAKRRKMRLAKKVFSGDCGRPLIRTPKGYGGTTLIGGRYVYEHRYLAEQKLGRLLRPGEVVHHVNGDIYDNRQDNLEVKSAGDHARDHRPEAPSITLTCPTCGKVFERPVREYKHKRKIGQKRFYCSRKCNVVN